MQMAGLLQMSGGLADTSHLERLQQQLDQARSEVQSLTNKLKDKEVGDVTILVKVCVHVL